MKITSDSHLDHDLPVVVLAWALCEFGAPTEFGIRTLTIPEEMPRAPCTLYGPITGDDPIGDDACKMAPRFGRTEPSRVVDLPARPSDLVTVIYGPDGEDDDIVLYTIFGGPASPKEPHDCEPHELAESERFWAEHALASGYTRARPRPPYPDVTLTLDYREVECVYQGLINLEAYEHLRPLLKKVGRALGEARGGV